MEPKIRELIHKHLRDSTEEVDNETAPKARIILTGHSAGGGVAALLYLHYLLRDAAFDGTPPWLRLKSATVKLTQDFN
jgi:putative lipase involved disintegration of autophagic bodies